MVVVMMLVIFIKSEFILEKDYFLMIIKNIGGSFNEIIFGFKEVLKIKLFWKFCIFIFFIFNVFNIVVIFIFFIIVYYLFNGDVDVVNVGFWLMFFGSLGVIFIIFIVILIVAWLLCKIGKK